MQNKRNLIMTDRELRLRYDRPWTTLVWFCAPTVFLMVVRGLYNLIDKILSINLATGYECHNQILIDFYNSQMGTNVSVIPSDEMRSYINIATQYSTQLFQLCFSFSVIIASGAAMHFSWAYGKKQNEKMSIVSANGFSNSLVLSIIIGIIAFLISYPGLNSILITSQMGKDYNPITRYLSWNYSKPFIFGMPALFMSFYFMSMLRNEGRNKAIIFMVCTGLLISLVMSLLFLIVFKMGIAGAMTGSVVGWTVQIMIAVVIIFIKKASYLIFSFKHLLSFRWKYLFDFMKSGFSNFLINVATMLAAYIGTILVVNLPNQHPSAINNNGISILQELISAYTPWISLVLSVGIGIMQGSRTIIAYSHSAIKNDRIIEILKKTFVLMMSWFFIVTILIIIFAKEMLLIFAFPELYVDKYCWWLVLGLTTLPLAGLTYLSISFFQGTNRNLICSWFASLRTLTVRVPLSLIGYGVSKWTHNPIFYFVFFGLIDLISAFFIIPIFYKKYVFYKKNLKDEEDSDYMKLSYYYSICQELRNINPENIKLLEEYYSKTKKKTKAK